MDSGHLFLVIKQMINAGVLGHKQSDKEFYLFQLYLRERQHI